MVKIQWVQKDGDIYIIRFTSNNNDTFRQAVARMKGYGWHRVRWNPMRFLGRGGWEVRDEELLVDLATFIEGLADKVAEMLAEEEAQAEAQARANDPFRPWGEEEQTTEAKRKADEARRRADYESAQRAQQERRQQEWEHRFREEAQRASQAKPQSRLNSMPVTFDDACRVLAVQRGISKVDLRKAYYKLAQVYHPDKPTGNTVKMQQINTAYAIVCRILGYV